MPPKAAGNHSVHAIGYVRVSTAEQAREGISLEAQRARIDAYAASRGLQIVGHFADEGISGRKASNRPGLESALEKVCASRGVLVVYSLSRLARSTKDAILIAERLSKAKAELVLLSESVDTTTAAGRMFYAVLAALAAFESDLIGERTRLAINHKRAAGQRYCCHAPYGWRVGSGERLVPDKPEQAVLETMRSLAAEGRSLQQIADSLKAAGIRNRKGSLFPKQQIHVLLRRTGNDAPHHGDTA